MQIRRHRRRGRSFRAIALDVPEQDRNREEDDAQPDAGLIEELLCPAALDVGGSDPAEGGGESGGPVLEEDHEREEQAHDDFDGKENIHRR